ncbi:hypothetical protein [Solibacillus sp. FSL H8-0538]|uniref:hypothetical protein n=1 Tax=Solibacillus sp. FSL H8-0538 TaxID=2921400 RepID=UPI0030F703CC
MTILTKDKQNKKGLGREEFGYGFDISADDLGVIGQNEQAKKQNKNENKEKPKAKNNPSILNE